jgi:hypothetical protein
MNLHGCVVESSSVPPPRLWCWAEGIPLSHSPLLRFINRWVVRVIHPTFQLANNVGLFVPAQKKADAQS